MTVEDLRNICSGLKGTAEDLKWENQLCFTVAGKIYLMVSLDVSPVSAIFKVLPENFDLIAGREGFKQAPYMAKNQWVMVRDIDLVDEKEWDDFIETSYNLIKSKLPKKIQHDIDGEPEKL